MPGLHDSAGAILNRGPVALGSTLALVFGAAFTRRRRPRVKIAVRAVLKNCTHKNLRKLATVRRASPKAGQKTDRTRPRDTNLARRKPGQSPARPPTRLLATRLKENKNRFDHQIELISLLFSKTIEHIRTRTDLNT